MRKYLIIRLLVLFEFRMLNIAINIHPGVFINPKGWYDYSKTQTDHANPRGGDICFISLRSTSL